MNIREAQQVLARQGLYQGGIDGVWGRGCRQAVAAAERKFRDAYTFDAGDGDAKRRRIAAVQACLDALGFEPGEVDGLWGNNTEEALNLCLYQTVHNRPEVITRNKIAGAPNPANIPSRRDCNEVYGRPGRALENNLEMIELPFSFRLDWSRGKNTKRMRVHPLGAKQLKKALIEVHAHYGEARWRELGLDIYGGTYKHRSIRGGTAWSMHAYGAAIDFHPEGNGLRTPASDALFGKPEYKDFLDIMEANEWLPAMRLWGADAMHFQRATL